nr:chaperone protein ClpB3, chloroplastic-like [Tanacetum cinerariifolium]
MGEELKGKVIGQDKAIAQLVKAIQRTRVGLKDPKKPIGSFVFLGPTGVGKTELAKVLATYLFDKEDALKTFSPEFLNRLDDVVVFNSLEKKDIHKIIDISLSKLLSRVLTLGYKVELTEKAKDFVADKGYDPKYGARPLNRA